MFKLMLILLHEHADTTMQSASGASSSRAGCGPRGLEECICGPLSPKYFQEYSLTNIM